MDLSPRARATSSLVFAASAAALLLTVAACARKESAEVQIRKALDEGVAALEARDTKRAAELLADDYFDKRGRNRDAIKRVAFFALQQGPVLVSLREVVINVDGDRADAQVKLLAVQRSGQLKTAADLLPTNARAMDLNVRLARDGDAWKVTAIDGDAAPSLD